MPDDPSPGDHLYPLWFVLATPGMRRGEALGLRWCDIDLDADHIAMRQSVVAVGREIQLFLRAVGVEDYLSADPSVVPYRLNSSRCRPREVTWQLVGTGRSRST